MKKTLLSVLVLAMATTGAFAQYWDFSRWSDETVNNLKADAAASSTEGWSDIEKSGDAGPGAVAPEATAGKCFWLTDNDATWHELSANAVPITELAGLLFSSASGARNLAIAVDYPETSLGSYDGGKYLWMGGSGKYFIIPNVAPGTKIRMAVESHKPSEGRGVELYVGRGNSGTKLKDIDGLDVTVPTTKQDQEWYLPEELADTPNEDGTYDITVRNTNGCHIYYLQVGDGGPGIEEAPNVALIYDGELDEDTDLMYNAISDATVIDLASIDAAQLQDSLETFDALVYSHAIKAETQYLALLGTLINRVPVLNVNADLATALGQGTIDFENGADGLTPLADYEEDELFTKDGVDVSMLGIAPAEEGYPAMVGILTPTADFAAEATLLAEPSFYQVGAGRNNYLLLPLNSALVDDGPNMGDNLPGFLLNIFDYLKATKRNVTAAGKPTVTATYGNNVTTVALASSTAGAKIYYTLDGTEPTEASTLYAEPFTLTSTTTVKAIALARGYNPSAILEEEVAVKAQAAAPTIAYTQDGATSTITLTGQGTIYFNFTGKNNTAARSQKYTEPVTITEPATIYAFISGDGVIDSEVASLYVSIATLTAETIRLDTLTHFDANKTDWFVDSSADGGTGSESAYYYWGKTQWNYYSDEVIGTEPVLDEDGNPLKDINGNDSIRNIYAPDPAAFKVIEPNTPNGWVLKSAGQVLTLEGTLAPEYGVGNGDAGRYADQAIDAIGLPTTGVITFGAKTTGEPYTARIETTDKYQAPFDVVVYTGNGNGSGKSDMEVQVSADGETWTAVGDVVLADMQRYWKKTRVSYEGTDQVYVRVAHVSGGTKAQVYDIFILNHGELSSQYDPAAGIESLTELATVLSREIFGLNGVRLGAMQQGVNIVRERLSDGSVRTVKVLVK